MYITNGRVAWQVTESFLLPEDGKWKFVKYINKKRYYIGTCGEYVKITSGDKGIAKSESPFQPSLI